MIMNITYLNYLYLLILIRVEIFSAVKFLEIA